MMDDSKEKRVALYARTANASQLSIAIQEAELRQYVERQGHSDPLVYADNGYNGVSYDRPAFRQLIADIENGKVGKVVVRDMTRISRDYSQAHGFMNILEMNGVELSAQDGSHEFHKMEAGLFSRMMGRKGRGDTGLER
jgi:DNA invertase Pin-like site-specific DNA recombinase